jgi:pantoate--beta-alanine ligase
MEIYPDIWDVHAMVQSWRRDGEKIGFIPTMGNLHEGHLRLIDVAKEYADRIVVSIYVNPLQFAANEDLSSYPRSLEQDIEKLSQRGVDLLFTPDDDAMYPEGTNPAVYVEVTRLAEQLEGAHRPGHFRGVATVVTKLFNIVQPDVAVFGEKDHQQLLVIRQLVNDLSMPIQVVGVPTVREAGGLAMSSRNSYLSAEQRKQAVGLYETLQYLRERVLNEKVEFADLEQAAIMQLEKKGFFPDYVAIRNRETLQEPSSVEEPLIILAAARLGQTRLIDNIQV